MLLVSMADALPAPRAAGDREHDVEQRDEQHEQRHEYFGPVIAAMSPALGGNGLRRCR